jgi:hypothetical protein
MTADDPALPAVDDLLPWDGNRGARDHVDQIAPADGVAMFREGQQSGEVQVGVQEVPRALEAVLDLLELSDRKTVPAVLRSVWLPSKGAIPG